MVSGLLSTSGGAVDLDEPDLQFLVHHEVEAKQLEAVVREVSCADGRLHTREAAPAGRGRRDPGDGLVTVHHVCSQIGLTKLPIDYSRRCYLSGDLLEDGNHICLHKHRLLSKLSIVTVTPVKVAYSHRRAAATCVCDNKTSACVVSIEKKGTTIWRRAELTQRMLASFISFARPSLDAKLLLIKRLENYMY